MIAADVKHIMDHDLPEKENWKVKAINELVDVKFERLVDNFSNEEIEVMMKFLCTE